MTLLTKLEDLSMTQQQRQPYPSDETRIAWLEENRKSTALVLEAVAADIKDLKTSMLTAFGALNERMDEKFKIQDGKMDTKFAEQRAELKHDIRFHVRWLWVQYGSLLGLGSWVVTHWHTVLGN